MFGKGSSYLHVLYMYMYTYYMLHCSLAHGGHKGNVEMPIYTTNTVYTCSSTYLSIPGHSTDILQWVELIAGAHGGSVRSQMNISESLAPEAWRFGWKGFTSRVRTAPVCWVVWATRASGLELVGRMREKETRKGERRRERVSGREREREGERERERERRERERERREGISSTVLH